MFPRTQNQAPESPRDPASGGGGGQLGSWLQGPVTLYHPCPMPAPNAHLTPPGAPRCPPRCLPHTLQNQGPSFFPKEQLLWGCRPQAPTLS